MDFYTRAYHTRNSFTRDSLTRERDNVATIMLPQAQEENTISREPIKGQLGFN